MEVPTVSTDLLASADNEYMLDNWENAFHLYKHYEQMTNSPNAHLYCRLGVFYQNGHYVEKDPEKANIYFNKALEYLPACIECGDTEAECDMGYMLANACGVAQDTRMAVEYYIRASQKGSVRAQCNLGYMYNNGRGIEQDRAMAVNYYQMAAEKGYVRALSNLGYMYSKGYGVQQDKQMAIKYYQMAADKCYARSQVNLGSVYEHGDGVEQDYRMAAKLYLLAADQGYPLANDYLKDIFTGKSGKKFQIVATEFLAHEWPNYTKKENFRPKNPLIETYMFKILAGECGPTNQAVVVEYMASQWPQLYVNGLLESNQQDTIMDVYLILKNLELYIPFELIVEITRLLFRIWLYYKE